MLRLMRGEGNVLPYSTKEGKKQETAAVKAGVSISSAHRIDNKKHCSFHPKKRDWKTRGNPFASVWDSEIVPLLEESSDIQSVTIFRELQENHPDTFSDGSLRTLQRHVRGWKAKHGPEKEVIFSQKHYPGDQGISDFTRCKSLQVTINGIPFDHQLYHYRLTWSKGTYAKVILGGESFTALSEGVQTAFRKFGIPKNHRTDSLSAAFKNLKERDDFTKGYKELCDHYGVIGTRNNRGKGHENGTIESSHRHLKDEIAQGLILRKSRNFESEEAYRAFIDQIVEARNKRHQKAIEEEKEILNPSPKHRYYDYAELSAKVASTSTINIKQVIYSVPSRLIGKRLTIHLYDNRFECYLGSNFILEVKRKRWNGGEKRVKSIDYRHVIKSLQRKPGAFLNYIHRDELMPNFAFRSAWEILSATLHPRKASKEYIGLLALAAKYDAEQEITQYLEEVLPNLPSVIKAEELLKIDHPKPSITVKHDKLASYNRLLGDKS